jgi:hypothetical protein
MLYLVDSGGQYPAGTTDVTRTVAIGAPTAEQRDRFTRVLRGHIALATARFPSGTTGAQLDAFARRALWEAGLDYDHGTGHGVGSYLGVHEGPQGISKRASTVALEPGMIVSNERATTRRASTDPIEAWWSYAAGRPAASWTSSASRLTLAPVDLALVDPAGLTAGDRVARRLPRGRARGDHAAGRRRDRTLAAATRPGTLTAIAPLDEATRRASWSRLVVRIRHRVRWSEIDAFSHANHAAYLEWFEEPQPLPGGRRPPAVLATTPPGPGRLEAQYQKPLAYPDEVLVTARTTALRRSASPWVRRLARRPGGELRRRVPLMAATGSGLIPPASRMMIAKDGARE